ncbi:histone deacetylase family protein [Neisseria animalis]|uniref:Histone deacetylase family protein n=1 Tax=Neisseria animalis TaxID=492 RepID=A0A5P3MRN4_NEIAN|nr:histone deacetylase family protein [Neisseria animalis]QEY24244.1 histone deacetylase family protein [Neisseria animalis]ROW32351.1 histone deacetylase family protein [Neisseria animalis]VEE06601.1 Histone deacetylase family protein [Neisseria animalis]
MKKLLQRLRTRLRRLFGKNARTVWISHPLFHRHNPGSNHPDRPERIAAIESALKAEGIWQHLQTAEAEEIRDAQLALVHPRRYLAHLEANRPQEGKIYRLDDDTVMNHESLTAARFAAGAVVQAVDMVMKKKAWHAFCAVRPPGHHAQSSKAGGFCLINNAAVGVMHAIAEYRLQRVAVIDFDVHHGDGTTEIFQNDPRVLLLDMYETDLFPFPDFSSKTRNPDMLHTPFQAAADSQTFRRTIRNRWLPRLAAFQPELVVLCAGFDAHREDETGRLHLHEADYAWLTHKIVQTATACPGRIVSVLEGGYTLTSLAKSAAAHIRVLAGLPEAESVQAYRQRLNGRKKT